MAFLLRRDPNMPLMIAGVALMMLLSLPFSSFPSLRSFLARNSRLMVAAGIACVAIAFLSIPVAAFMPPRSVPPDIIIGFLLSFSIAGVVLISFSHSAKRQHETERLESTKIVPSVEERARFSWMQEALAANSFVLRHAFAFFRIVGPWVAVCAIPPLLMLQFLALKNGSIGNYFQPVIKLDKQSAVGVLLVSSLCAMIAIASAMVVWMRFVLKGQVSALPNRSALFFVFALWVFGGFVKTFSGMIEPDLANGFTFLHLNADASSYAVTIIWAFAIWLLGGFALVLPGAVVRDERMNLQIAAGYVRTLGRNFGTGLLLALLLGEIASKILEALISNAGGSVSVQQLATVVPVVLLFFGIAAASTYLARGYQVLISRYPESQSASAVSELPLA